jgi:beta-xylosidase
LPHYTLQYILLLPLYSRDDKIACLSCVSADASSRFRLRLTDVKAEHYERKVATVEAERDAWEKKYEEIMEKYKSAQDELDKISQQLNDM